MELTGDHIVALLDAHFTGLQATCPSCQTAAVQFDRRNTTDGYRLHVSCVRCGSVLLHPEHDPRVDQFREWTTDEEAAIVAAHLSGQTPLCPADQTPLFIDVAPAYQVTAIRVSCPRCGFWFDRDIPHG